MIHHTLTTFLAVTPEGTQGVNNTSALIAAISGLVGAVVGGTVTIIVSRISSHAENDRQNLRLDAELKTLEQTHKGELERQIREAAVGLSDAWGQIIRAHDHYYYVQEAAISQSDIDGTRTQVVEALTRFGSQLNKLLVLPINKPLEAQVFVVDEAVDLFRGSFMNPAQSLQYRKAVSPTILKLFSLLREGNLVHIANNTRRISDKETIEDAQIHGPE